MCGGGGIVKTISDFVSDVPVVGNIYDTVTKAVYDELDTVGNVLGLNESNNLFGMNQDEFTDEVLAPVALASAGSGMTSPFNAGSGVMSATEAAELAAATETAASWAPAMEELAFGSMEAANLAAPLTAAASAAPETITGAAPLLSATEAAGMTADADLAAILSDMGANASANEAILAGGAGAGAGLATPYPQEVLPAVGPGDGATMPSTFMNGAQPFEAMPEGMNAPSTYTFGREVAGLPANVATKGGGSMYESILDWIAQNKMTAMGLGMLGSNIAGSFGQADMLEGLNKANQGSYQKYVDTLNPPDTVKTARYNQLASNARTQSSLAKKRLNESLASRGVRGAGTAAPTGDMSELDRQALNEAYNTIFGQYNVPSAPGPADYSPSAGNLALSNATQTFNQSLPLLLLLSKYGAV